MLSFRDDEFSRSCVSRPRCAGKIAVAKKYGKPIDGHAPGLTSEKLRLYAEAGISTDHECITIEETEEKIHSGMKIFICEGRRTKGYFSCF